MSGHGPSADGADTKESDLAVLLFELRMVSDNLSIAKLLMTDPDAVNALEQRLEALQECLERQMGGPRTS